MKKAVIFDLDGTLSDTIESIKYCGDLAVAPLGMGPFDREQYFRFVGDGAATLIRRLLAAGGDTQGVHFEEAMDRYREIFKEHCMYKVAPYPGIRELLKELKMAGVAMAVFSNKPHSQTVDVVNTLFGEGCFDMVLGQQEGYAVKPDPTGVFRILDALSLKPEDILYLGDTDTDMKTGKSAGVFTVGALWGFRSRQELEENHADAVIAYPTDLLEFII